MSDDLVKRLQTVSAMISLGERISWGQDTALMDEAAAEITRLQARIKVLEADWRCCGCGCNPPFECQCATDVAWRKKADGVNEGLSKSEYRRSMGMTSRAALSTFQEGGK